MANLVTFSHGQKFQVSHSDLGFWMFMVERKSLSDVMWWLVSSVIHLSIIQHFTQLTLSLPDQGKLRHSLNPSGVFNWQAFILYSDQRFFFLVNFYPLARTFFLTSFHWRWLFSKIWIFVSQLTANCPKMLHNKLISVLRWYTMPVIGWKEEVFGY